MKIVHLCTMDFGGAGKAAYRLHKGLQAIGLDSTMLVVSKKTNDPSVIIAPPASTPSPSDRWAALFQNWNTSLVCYPQRPRGFEVFTNTVSDVRFDFIQELQDADVINLHWVAGLFDYEHAAQVFKGKKVVWTLHDMNPFTGGCHYAGSCKEYQQSCGSCPQLGSKDVRDLSWTTFHKKAAVYHDLNIAVVTPSKWLGSCSSASTLLRLFRHKVIPYGFPLDTFRLLDRERIRASLSISTDTKVVLFGADYIANQRKGFQYLLEALHTLASSGFQQNITLIVFGNMDPSIELSCGYPILDLGSIDNEELMSMIYNAADVFVLPSLEDNLPNTVVEALACGTPVVAFDIGGVPDMVEHKKTGYLATPLDVHDLACGIYWCLVHLSLETRNTCREKAVSSFSLERQANEYFQLYSQMSLALPVISVITPSFNQASFIEQTIQSVLAQNYPYFEHIVIDGGSTDSTVDILKSYAHLKWVSEPDCGQSNALNKGFQKASGEIIAWINSDDWYEPGVFGLIANYFTQYPDRNVVMGDCNLVDDHGVVFDKVTNHARGFDELKKHWVPRSIPTQPAIFFRKKLLDEFGCLDETLYYAMDYDLWMRFSRLNRFFHINLTVANYRFHSAAKGGDQDWSKFVPECRTVVSRYVVPYVSVIIPCYNYARYLPEAVASVINQSFQHTEIIIVDDGSTDNSIEIAEWLIKSNPQHSIRLITQLNSGHPSHSRNLGIANATGTYILPLDADDKIAPMMIEKCLNLLENDSTISIAYTDRLDFDGVDQIVSAQEYDFSKLKFENHLSYCALYKKDVWQAVGGYKIIAFEDWNFWIEAGSKGFAAKRIPEPLFMYRRHDTGKYQRDSLEGERGIASIMIHNRNLYSGSQLKWAFKVIDCPSPTVSVVVPTYNRPAMLQTAIQSVLDQTFQNFEIIVVNDAGLDVADVVNLFNSPKIVYLSHEVNKGLAAARNTGIRTARGKYIAYLDDDDIYYPQHLEVLTSFLETSEYKVAYTDANLANQRFLDGKYQTVTRECIYSSDFDYDRILSENFIPVLCVMHEKTCLDISGEFDEMLNRHEDWDLWIRMSRHFAFAHIPTITCEYTHRDDGSGMVTGSAPAFLRTFDRIVDKYRSYREDNPKLQQAQCIRRYQMINDTYHFIFRQLEQLQGIELLHEPDDALIEILTQTGATRNEITSGFYLQKAVRSKDDLVKAVSFLQQSLESDPNNIISHQLAAELFDRLGNNEEYTRHLEKLFEINPYDADLLKALVAIFMQVNPAKANYYEEQLLGIKTDGTAVGRVLQPGVTVRPLKVAVFSLDAQEYACARIRLLSPLGFLKNEVAFTWGVSVAEDSFLTDLHQIDAADILIVQRFYPRKGTIPYLEQMLLSGKPVVYDVDDLLTDLPESNRYKVWAEETAEILRQYLPRFTAVTVSTEQLAEEIRKYNEKVYVLPNLLDEAIWNASPIQKSRGPVVIGFAGTATHAADLLLIEDALVCVSQKYGDRVAFRFMGDATQRLSALTNFSFVDFQMDYNDYAASLQKGNVDIAVVPLEDNRFNVCKSNIKWLEYSASGIAGVYADLEPYNSCIKHGETGLLVGQGPEQWFQAICLLIDNPALRQKIAENARRKVLATYTLRQGAYCWLDLYNAVLERYENGSTLPDSSCFVTTVSIVIPIYNQLNLTRNCLDVLFSTLSVSAEIELIVINNGSTDGTTDYLLPLGSRIKVITNPTNLGFARACNQGAAIATGQYLVFLNNDTVPQPGWLDALLEPVVSGKADIVGARLLYPDRTIQHAGVVFDEQGPLHCFKRMPADSAEANKPRYLQAVTAACMLVMAQVFQQLGGFDEEYKNGFEDIDFCLNALQHGYRIYYQPKSVLIHYEESSQGRKLHDEENYARFLGRWLGRWQIDHTPCPVVVSIIVPVYNQLNFTRNCLERVLVTIKPLSGSVEIIVVDNGSTDGTLDYLKTLGSKVRIVHHQQNLGFAKGCNSGVLKAQGQYLVFLNNDTEPRDGWLEAMLQVFEQVQLVGVVGSKLLFPDGSIQHAGVAIVRDPYLPAELSPCHVGYQSVDAPEYSQIRAFQAVTAACMMIRAELFKQVGGFDEGYWNGFEDIDLCFKVHEAGYQIIYQPASVVIHHESKSGKERKEAESKNLQRLQERWSGRIRPEYVRVSPEQVEPLWR